MPFGGHLLCGSKSEKLSTTQVALQLPPCSSQPGQSSPKRRPDPVTIDKQRNGVPIKLVSIATARSRAGLVQAAE